MASDTKLGPDTIAELRAAEAKATPGAVVMWAGSGWPRAWNVVADADVVWPVAHRDTSTDAEPFAVFLRHEDQWHYVLLRNHAPALLDAAERCALADEHGAVALGLAFAQAKQDLTTATRERDEMVERITEIVDNALGLQVPGTTPIAMLDALEKDFHGHRLDASRVAAELTRVEERANDLARRLGEAHAALLALKKWDDEYSDLVERSKKWIHDSTLWESNEDLAPEWQALWNRYPKSVVDITATLTTPPADGSGEGA